MPAPAPEAPALQEIETTVLLGDPTQPGIYTIALRIPAHTVIQAHTHRDDRVAIVVSGDLVLSATERVMMRPRSHRCRRAASDTEPAGQPHFAATKDEPVTVFITGHGPSDTNYVEAAAPLPKRE